MAPIERGSAGLRTAGLEKVIAQKLGVAFQLIKLVFILWLVIKEQISVEARCCAYYMKKIIHSSLSLIPFSDFARDTSVSAFV